MKAVILAGGFGTRISEETLVTPKPLIEIENHPILWHIMKNYTFYGINEFVICCGYKGYMIKEYFANYFLHMSDVTFDMKNNQMNVHKKHADPWSITLVDTGIDTMTGGRLKKIILTIYGKLAKRLGKNGKNNNNHIFCMKKHIFRHEKFLLGSECL